MKGGQRKEDDNDHFLIWMMRLAGLSYTRMGVNSLAAASMWDAPSQSTAPRRLWAGFLCAEVRLRDAMLPRGLVWRPVGAQEFPKISQPRKT